MPFACIFVPDFPVAAIVRNEPAASALHSKAVAVLEGNPPIVRVMSLNEAARQGGVYIGMTRVQAESAPDVILRKRSLPQEESAHAALLDCAYGFSPKVESTSSDTVIVDISGLEQLFGPPLKIARDLAQRVCDVGMEANVAVASNPDAALHAARGFPGVTVIAEGQEAARLGELPIDVLAPTPEMLETFERWGVRNLRALAALPPLALTQRVGQQGLHLQKMAAGAIKRELVPAAQPFHFEEALELEDSVDLLEPLAFLLNRLIDQLCARLSSRALATNELRLRFELEVATDQDISTQTSTSSVTTADYRRTLKLPVPMQDARIFLKLLQLDLQANPPQAPVKKIWLSAEPVRPRVAQSGLFMPEAPEAERLELTIARIRGFVGQAENNPHERVGRAELLDSHRADAFRMQHFTAELAGKKKPATAPAARLLGAIRMFRPPLAATVELVNGVPASLQFNGTRARVIALAGPWKSSGEWWSLHAWAREEWDIAVTTPELLLLKLVKEGGSWLVEGTYD
jgi:protein ImuB